MKGSGKLETPRCRQGSVVWTNNGSVDLQGPMTCIKRGEGVRFKHGGATVINRVKRVDILHGPDCVGLGVGAWGAASGGRTSVLGPGNTLGNGDRLSSMGRRLSLNLVVYCGGGKLESEGYAMFVEAASCLGECGWT